ncbi:hypothetical protein [Legionella sp. WA2024007413]
MQHILSTIVRKPQTSRATLLFYSFILLVSLMFLICHFFELHWRTNDDVGMSMIAHGYGIAKLASPNILFSNVLWGYLVGITPSINGVLGYSIMTLCVLTIVGVIIFYGLSQLAGYGVAFSILLLIVVPAILWPQFTINAGLLQISAIICWCLYAKQRNLLVLVGGCLLAYFSYLIRSQEFWLVLIISLPILPWRILFLRTVKIAFFILALAILVSATINYQAYQSEDWNAYNTLNPARASFTDYGAGTYLKQHKEILAQHGYTNNDIDLISNWFFVDPHIANPKTLKIMLKQLGPLPRQERALDKAWLGVKALWSRPLLITLITALLLGLLHPSWKIAVSWGLCVAAIFTLGLLGRPGVLHVYVPVVSLLLIVPFLNGTVPQWRNYLSIALLLFAALFNTSKVFSEAKLQQIVAAKTRAAYVHFPDGPMIVWGAAFPYELIYPVIGVPPSAMLYKHYGLGTSTLAPFTLAYAKQKEGNGLIGELFQKDGIAILAPNSYLKILSIYCNEHFSGKLEEIKSSSYGGIKLRQQRCIKNKIGTVV